jgi:hypothetical protein
MSNRFHNKFHRANHHSQRTAKNVTILDAALDPIASYIEPFQGEFYTDGEIVTNAFLSASNDVISNSNLRAAGNVYATTAVLSGDLFVAGNARIEGTTTQINTEVYATSALSISNLGTGPALKVTQFGNNVIAEFYDDTDIALFIDGRAGFNGNVGVGTNTPNQRLTVVGSISSNWTIFAKDSNSEQWKSAYSNVQSNSANWDSTYTTVQSNSSTNWNYQGTDLKALSGNWDSTYTTVQSNSSTNWNYQGTDLKSLSAQWQSTYITVNSLSALWEETADIIPTVTSYLSTNFVTISGLTITENLSVSGNVTINGTLKCASFSAPPVNTTSPVAWFDVEIAGSAYKLPLYQ